MKEHEHDHNTTDRGRGEEGEVEEEMRQRLPVHVIASLVEPRPPRRRQTAKTFFKLLLLF